MRIVLFLFVIFISALSFSSLPLRKNYPQDYFRSPVTHSIKLSGTFGELRPNHFHAGIDIKSRNGKTGEPILAIAEGYVSRVKVAAGGYGKVIYVDHPNGYTSVYAHLDRFSKALENYVKTAQYKAQTYELELFPKPGEFSLDKGEELGKLGLSGRSYGPHLHFEIRDTKTEKPINPLLFGIQVTDNRPPKLHELKIYSLNDKRVTQATKTLKLIKLKNNRYKIKGDTMSIGAWRAGFGLKTYDHFAGVANWNGVYSVAMYQDDQLIYDFEMETFAFDETRYINAHLDYEEQVTKKSYFNRCYALPGNKLSIYPNQLGNGVIDLHQHQTSKITLKAKDYDGNTASLEFWVKRKEISTPKSKTYNYILPYQEENMIETSSLYLFFPKNSLYEPLYLQYQASAEKSNDVYSSVHHIHDYKMPVHRYFDIGIQPVGLPDSLRGKAFIAYCGKNNKVKNCGGTWKDGRLMAKVRDFGDYSIMVDKKAPRIIPKRFKKDMRGFSKMSFAIKENYSVARNLDEFSYTATVDGQWILFSYDAKKDLLTHRFDGRIGKGKHVLRLEVQDHQGNRSVFERPFTR
ncbi:MAG: M23 family metallopeptidase [Saprospiraceae bacterium]